MTDIPRSKLDELRAQLVRDRDATSANLNGMNGAIQAIDMLLAPNPKPAKQPKKPK